MSTGLIQYNDLAPTHISITNLTAARDIVKIEAKKTKQKKTKKKKR